MMMQFWFIYLNCKREFRESCFKEYGFEECAKNYKGNCTYWNKNIVFLIALKLIALLKRNIVVSVHFFLLLIHVLFKKYISLGQDLLYRFIVPLHVTVNSHCVFSFDGGAVEFLLADRKQGNYDRLFFE